MIKIPFHYLSANEIVDLTFQGMPGFGRKMTCYIDHKAPIITDLYVHISHLEKKIKSFHRIYDTIRLEMGNQLITNIPISYLVLYLKVVKGIDINSFSDKINTVIPIKFSELANIPFIVLPQYLETRLVLSPNTIKSFTYDVRRFVELDLSWLSYKCYINMLPKDIWKIILYFMDNLTWSNLRQTCKFFYSLESENDINCRYDKSLVKLKDLAYDNCTLKVQYHNLTKESIEKLKEYKFTNECRSFDQISKSLENEDTLKIHYFVWQEKPIEFIIIDIDCYEKNVIESIQFIETNKNIIRYEANEKKIYYQLQTDNNWIPEKENEVRNEQINDLIPDSSFYSKMNDPNHNRYMYYCNGFLDDIHITFRKKVIAKINVFTAMRNWVTFQDNYAKVFL
ncbi:MAG: hypothetical protein Barrevirus13_15 [Barrevirus sp.]|uniref:F-box domain-containing protein n=1 Tax=Barrevirus sp. TaxID=2487763 RepID=A0A3G4ZQF1_9VIRU|nr:MAG: hypothetical protein Barrevirus13_15 [Barrevirus sp.]